MREREGFLDKLRVAATCAVVLLHTITGAMDITDMRPFPLEEKVFLTALDLICWCVPVFVLISGYLFLNPVRKISMRDMLARYCRRILLALFLFGVPYACLEQIALEHTFRMEMPGRAFLMVLRGESWSHMWYLYLILLLYLMTPALKRLLGLMSRPAVYALSAALFFAGSILPWLAGALKWEYPAALSGSIIYVFYYICGYLFAASPGAGAQAGERVAVTEKESAAGKTPRRSGTERAAEGRKPMRAAALWALPGVSAALALIMAVLRLAGIHTVRTVYSYPLTAVLALLLFGWGSVWGRSGGKSAKNTDFWKRAAALTFAVYLIHPVFLNFFYKFLHITPLSFCIWLSLPLFFLGTLLLSFAAAWVLYRVPVLRKYVL